MKCSGILQKFTNLIPVGPDILSAQRGVPAKVDYQICAAKYLKTFAYLALANFSMTEISRSDEPANYSLAGLGVRGIRTMIPIALAVLGFVQLQSSQKGVQNSNLNEFISSPMPSKELTAEVLGSEENIDELVRRTRANPSALQKRYQEPLIAQYVDRASPSLRNLTVLFNAAPWTNEDKFKCLATLVARENILLLQSVVYNGLIKADDLDLNQKKALWFGRPKVVEPILEQCKEAIIQEFMENPFGYGDTRVVGDIELVNELVRRKANFQKIGSFEPILCSLLSVSQSDSDTSRLQIFDKLYGAAPWSAKEMSQFLQRVVAYDDLPLLEHVVQKGVIKPGDVSLKDQSYIWLSIRSEKTAQLLKKMGFDPNTLNKEGYTPLQSVVKSQYATQIIPYLLAVGADPAATVLVDGVMKNAAELADDPALRAFLEKQISLGKNPEQI